MQESHFYRHLQDKFTRENTIENTLALLENRFTPDAVDALKPALLKISDLQRLKQILLAASEAQDPDAFAEILNEE